MKGTASIYFFVHTDTFDVLNVGFNFHSQPSHDVFGIGLCQKSDDLCHDELLGKDFRNIIEIVLNCMSMYIKLQNHQRKKFL